MVVARLDLRLGKNVVVLGWTILAAGGQNAGGALLVEACSWLLVRYCTTTKSVRGRLLVEGSVCRVVRTNVVVAEPV